MRFFSRPRKCKKKAVANQEEDLVLLFSPRYVQVQNVTSIAARKRGGQSNGVIDSVLLQAAQPGGQVKGEHVVYLELGVDWTSYRSKVMGDNSNN